MNSSITSFWSRGRLDTSRKQVQFHRCFLSPASHVSQVRVRSTQTHSERKRDVCPYCRLGQMMRPLTIGSWRKARGRGTGKVCARRIFCSGCTWKSTGGVHAVCMRGYGWEILGVKEARLSWTAIDCVLFFFSSTLSDEQCSNLSFENPNPNPKNRTYTVERSQRHRRYTRCVLWEVTMYGHLPFKKLGFLAVQLWPIFLLKYSLRQAMLQLEFRWSKPDESHSEQSKTETRKTAFCSAKTLKSYMHWPTGRGRMPRL